MSKSLETLREIGEEVIKVTCLAGWVEETTKEAYGKRFDEIEKELKALEIIKKDPQRALLISNYKDYDEYVNDKNPYYIEKELMKKDEFDLLKEVLK